jgi:hypothetical protein
LPKASPSIDGDAFSFSIIEVVPWIAPGGVSPPGAIFLKALSGDYL